MPATERLMIQASVESGTRAAGAVTDFILGQNCRRVLINNTTGGVVYYRASQDASANQASTTVYDGIIFNNESKDISLNGARSIQEVSCWLVSAGTTTTFTVTGLV